MIYAVETPAMWAKVEARFREKGYSLFQFQYDIDMPEGFHAWFWLSASEIVEMVTHSAEVRQGILWFNAPNQS